MLSTLHLLKITECVEYKRLQLTYEVEGSHNYPTPIPS